MKGLVPATRSENKVPSNELPSKVSIRWSDRRVQNVILATCPANSKWFEFVREVERTCLPKLSRSLRGNCSWDRSLRLNETMQSIQKRNIIVCLPMWSLRMWIAMIGLHTASFTSRGRLAVYVQSKCRDTHPK